MEHNPFERGGRICASSWAVADMNRGAVRARSRAGGGGARGGFRVGGGAGAGRSARGMAAAAGRAPGPGFSACFDSGNGVLQESAPDGSGGPWTLKVAIKDDPYTEVDGRNHKMWFHFKVSNLQDVEGPVRVVLTNAGDCSYPSGWEGTGAEGYKCVFSTDRENWRRLEATKYSGGGLSMTLDASAGGQLAGADAVWLAYFAPYSQERYMQLMGGLVASSPRASTATIGQTLDGADMEMITVRGAPAPEGKKKLSLWFIARQHPGESQASWWMDGFLRRLLDQADPIATALLSLADVRVVPMMNPDGARRGYLRTNAAGANLNREWAAPKEDYSPEVFHVLREMKASGLDFCLDVHGDEALPYNFVAGGEGCPAWSPRLEALQKDWSDAYQRASPDFQQVYGYGKDEPGKANLAICSNALLQAFDALVMTLEMPFKDNANSPDPELGWSPARCDRLGAAVLDATLAVAHRLR